MRAEEQRRELRAALAPGTAVGVSEAMIHDLVHAFYSRVSSYDVIGPVFERAVADWDAHLAKLCDFWSSVLLMSGRFKGTPMATHALLPDIPPGHFARWLELFQDTARSRCPSPAAALFIAKSEIIGQSLQLGIARTRGNPTLGRIPL